MKKKIIITALVAITAMVISSCGIDVILPPADYHFIVVNKTNTPVKVVSTMTTAIGGEFAAAGELEPEKELEILHYELRNYQTDSYDATFYELLTGDYVSVYLQGTDSPAKTWFYENRNNEGRQLFRRTDKNEITVTAYDKVNEYRQIFIKFFILDEDIN